MNSYLRGIAKAIDANNEVRVFHSSGKSTIRDAWNDVGKDLSDAMLEYEQKKENTSHVS